jgi:ATP-dependent DNA ligase
MRKTQCPIRGHLADIKPQTDIEPPTAPSTGPDWLHEIKHDGYRLIVQREGSHATTSFSGHFGFAV